MGGGSNVEHLTGMKNAAMATGAVFASVVAQYFGGWDATMQALIVFMVADYLTGLAVAGVFKRSGKSAGGGLESRAGFEGIVRKGMILLVVLVGTQLDGVAQTNGLIRNATVFFFLGNEGLSIVENMGLMGVPMPKKMREALEALRDKEK